MNGVNDESKKGHSLYWSKNRFCRTLISQTDSLNQPRTDEMRRTCVVYLYPDNRIRRFGCNISTCPYHLRRFILHLDSNGSRLKREYMSCRLTHTFQPLRCPKREVYNTPKSPKNVFSGIFTCLLLGR